MDDRAERGAGWRDPSGDRALPTSPGAHRPPEEGGLPGARLGRAVASSRRRAARPVPSPWGVVLLTAVAPMTWGTTYLVTTESLPPDRPLLAAAVRALPAGLALTLAARRVPHGAWWWRAGVLGVLNIGAFFALLFVAAYRLPGGVAAVLGAVQPLLVVLLGVALLGERLRLRPLVLGIVGVAGVGLIVLSASAGLDRVGVVAGVLATASMATGVVLTKRWGRPVGVVAFTGWQLTAGGAVLVPLVLAVEGVPGSVTAGQVGGFVYLAVVGTALAYVLWLRGIAMLPVQGVAFLGLLSPVVAALAGWVVLGQTLTAGQAAGAGLALAALVLAQRGGGGSPRPGGTVVPPVARSAVVPDGPAGPTPPRAALTGPACRAAR